MPINRGAFLAVCALRSVPTTKQERWKLLGRGERKKAVVRYSRARISGSLDEWIKRLTGSKLLALESVKFPTNIGITRGHTIGDDTSGSYRVGFLFISLMVLEHSEKKKKPASDIGWELPTSKLIHLPAFHCSRNSSKKKRWRVPSNRKMIPG